MKLNSFRVANGLLADDHNIFYGSFYNRKVGEIELIEIPELRLKDFSQAICTKEKEE